MIAADKRQLLEAKEMEMKQQFQYEAMGKRDENADPTVTMPIRAQATPEPPCRVEDWYRCRTEKEYVRGMKTYDRPSILC